MRVLAPLALFASVYLATFAIGLWLSVPNAFWIGLASVVVATTMSVAMWERGDWNLGLRVEPRHVFFELAAGLGLATILVGSADLLVVVSTGVWHGLGDGFPLEELLLVFAPAALHEELLFRGYAFQKLWRWRRGVAIVIMSLAFTVLHLGNYGITPVGLTNIFLGGVLLSLAYERYRRLWFPIGIHFGWNILSGPLLGHPVSGYVPEATVFTVVGDGPSVLTGGDFGIEGSIWMTVMEIVAIVLLSRKNVEH